MARLLNVTVNVRRDRLAAINLSTNMVRLVWNDALRGLHVYVSRVGTAGACTHYFWEQRSNAWFVDILASTNFNPLAVCTLDGDSPNDRVMTIGTRNGYILYESVGVSTDDGSSPSSEVWLGPIQGKRQEAFILKELQAILGRGSAGVTYDVFADVAAETAFNASSLQTGTWASGRNKSNMVRLEGTAFYIRITKTSDLPWQMENLMAKIRPLGDVFQRMLK